MYRAVAKFWSTLLALVGVAILASSCATNQHALGPKFREGNAANVVIRYASDSTVFMWKPDGREGAFYRIFSREEICEEIARRDGPRDLAVVVLNYHRFPELDRQAALTWAENLNQLNFRRVVFVRANESLNVNGMRVVEDRFLAQGLLKAPDFSLATSGSPSAR